MSFERRGKQPPLDFTTRHKYKPHDPFNDRSNPFNSRFNPFDDTRPQYLIFALKAPIATFGNRPKSTGMRSKLQIYMDEHPIHGRNRNNKPPQPSHSRSTRQEIVAVEASSWDAFSIMNGCLDASFLKADIGARIMKLPSSRFLRVAGGATGLIGLGLNGIDAIRDPTFNNYAKLGAGLVLLGLATFGGSALIPLVIAGNVGMIAWDLGEGLYEHIQKNKR